MTDNRRLQLLGAAREVLQRYSASALDAIRNGLYGDREAQLALALYDLLLPAPRFPDDEVVEDAVAYRLLQREQEHAQARRAALYSSPETLRRLAGQ